MCIYFFDWLNNEWTELYIQRHYCTDSEYVKHARWQSLYIWVHFFQLYYISTQIPPITSPLNRSNPRVILLIFRGSIFLLHVLMFNAALNNSTVRILSTYHHHHRWFLLFPQEYGISIKSLNSLHQLQMPSPRSKISFWYLFSIVLFLFSLFFLSSPHESFHIFPVVPSGFLN